MKKKATELKLRIGKMCIKWQIRDKKNTTEVLYDIENAMNTLTKVMSRVSNRADVCGDSLSPSF